MTEGGLFIALLKHFSFVLWGIFLGGICGIFYRFFLESADFFAVFLTTFLVSLMTIKITWTEYSAAVVFHNSWPQLIFMCVIIGNVAAIITKITNYKYPPKS
jgi:hypothetical protein